MANFNLPVGPVGLGVTLSEVNPDFSISGSGSTRTLMDVSAENYGVLSEVDVSILTTGTEAA